MYIRRKVFSVALDENGEERYFSTNEIINEDDYLDEVMYSDLDEKMFDYVEERIARGEPGYGRNVRAYQQASLADMKKYYNAHPELQQKYGSFAAWRGKNKKFNKSYLKAMEEIGTKTNTEAMMNETKKKAIKNSGKLGKFIAGNKKALLIGGGLAAAGGGYGAYKYANRDKK